MAESEDALVHAHTEGSVLDTVRDNDHVVGEVKVILGSFRKEAAADCIGVVLGLVPGLYESVKGSGDLGLAADTVILNETEHPLNARLVIRVALNQIGDALLGLLLLVQNGEELNTRIVFLLSPGILERQHLFVELEGLFREGRIAITLGAVIRIAVLNRIFVFDGLVEGLL